MARIRTTKPEFWTSEQIAECSPITRLAFIGLWSFCDDNGVHPASAKRLKMEVFPSDALGEQEIQAMVEELLAADLLRYYEVADKGYWQVTGWHKHQKIERPTYRHPLPNGVQPPQKSPTPRRKDDDKSPSDLPRNGKESNGKNMSCKQDATSILQYLNEKAGRNYEPVKANLDLIVARLNDGASPDRCKAVIDVKVREWREDPKWSKYLRPKTLFSPTNFAQYAGEVGGSASTGAREGWE